MFDYLPNIHEKALNKISPNLVTNGIKIESGHTFNVFFNPFIAGSLKLSKFMRNSDWLIETFKNNENFPLYP